MNSVLLIIPVFIVYNLPQAIPDENPILPRLHTLVNSIKMKQLHVQNGELKPVFLKEGITYYEFTCNSNKKLSGCMIYFKDFAGMMERTGNYEYKSVLTKRNTILPRSIYPYLTSGSLLVCCKKWMFDQYMIIKDYE